MKKYVIVSMLALCFSVLNSGCFLSDEGEFFGCLVAEGPTVDRTFNLDPFHSIRLDMDADVEVRQGSVQSVEVRGSGNIIDDLRTEVSNGVWRIRTHRRCVANTRDLKVLITIPDIRELSVSGSGTIISDGLLQTGDLELNVSGSGKIDALVESNDIDARISGSGDIILNGDSRQNALIISGSGDLRASQMRAKEYDITISGSGGASIDVQDFLKVRISGSGDVLYKGNPNKDVSISGSGSVRPQ